MNINFYLSHQHALLYILSRAAGGAWLGDDARLDRLD
jgi:hypothetical protein